MLFYEIFRHSNQREFDIATDKTNYHFFEAQTYNEILKMEKGGASHKAQC